MNAQQGLDRPRHDGSRWHRPTLLTQVFGLIRANLRDCIACMGAMGVVGLVVTLLIVAYSGGS